MSERMTDEEFALHERGQALQRGNLLREARRARRAEAELLAIAEELAGALECERPGGIICADWAPSRARPCRACAALARLEAAKK